MDERDSHCPHLLYSEATAKGTGLEQSAGKEDPVAGPQVVAVRGLLTAGGGPVPPSPAFARLRDGAAAGGAGGPLPAAEERRRRRFEEEVFPALARAGWARSRRRPMRRAFARAKSPSPRIAKIAKTAIWRSPNRESRKSPDRAIRLRRPSPSHARFGFHHRGRPAAPHGATGLLMPAPQGRTPP